MPGSTATKRQEVLAMTLREMIVAALLAVAFASYGGLAAVTLLG